ncbi:unnamed protein product [Protopolystoma xenopodis]|uniref:Uncharacterized protein n=1 Tax=Protopolystoma xenopodis TaxID=117903 RepID=A0A3S5AB73_9PLAT|nr:unnamed protein product [Protopolystoma xenopodis]
MEHYEKFPWDFCILLCVLCAEKNRANSPISGGAEVFKDVFVIILGSGTSIPLVTTVRQSFIRIGRPVGCLELVEMILLRLY